MDTASHSLSPKALASAVAQETIAFDPETMPIITTGMHRSGTSFTTSLLARLGVNVGDELLPATIHNRAGYFEDVAFVKLQQQMIRTAVNTKKPGVPDWGWTTDESWSDTYRSRWEEPARTLLQQRRQRDGLWGWKDPRTTLFLDFWDTLLPQAHYLLLYRFPWEVVDSMQRLGAKVLTDKPESCYAIWNFYNRRLLDFYNHHAERCLLINVNTLVGQVEQLPALLMEKWGLQLDSPPDLAATFDPAQFNTWGQCDPLVDLLEVTQPDSMQLLRQLDAAADLPGPNQWQPTGQHRLANQPTTPVTHSPVTHSVVIACYNDGEFLVEAIASAERTVPDDTELIIVNDGSTEARTIAILAKLKQLGYRIIDQPNQGLAHARNAAIAASRGKYILPLDADNRLRSGYLQLAAQVMDKEPEIGVVYSDKRLFGLLSGVISVPEFDLKEQLLRPSIDACAVFRRQLWEACGGYDPALRIVNDWELWIHAATRGWRFVHIPRALFDYRVRSGSLSRMETLENARAEWRYILKKHRATFLAHWPEAQDEEAFIQQRVVEYIAVFPHKAPRPFFQRLRQRLVNLARSR